MFGGARDRRQAFGDIREEEEPDPKDMYRFRESLHCFSAAPGVYLLRAPGLLSPTCLSTNVLHPFRAPNQSGDFQGIPVQAAKVGESVPLAGFPGEAFHPTSRCLLMSSCRP